MRRPHTFTLLGVGLPLLLLQLTPSACFTTTGGTGLLFNLPPTVVLNADVVRGVAPLKVTFSSSSSTDDGVITERLWEFGDGATSPDISPEHTYTTTGTFTVRLTLTDDQNAKSSATVTIFVTQAPVAVIKIAGDVTSAEFAPAQFDFDGTESFDPDAEEDDVLRYQWDFGDGSREVVAAVTHTFATAGTYRVRLTVTDAVGVTGFTEVIIEVGIPRPTIDFRVPPASVSNIVCPPSSPLWVAVTYTVEPGVPFTLRAGLDGDQDACDSQVALFDSTSGQATLTLLDPVKDQTLKQGRVWAAAFAPNSQTVLAGGEDGTVRLYDATNGSIIRRYAGSGAEILALAFAPDGQTFVAGFDNGQVTQWNVESSTPLRSFTGHNTAVNAVAYAPNSGQIAAGSESGRIIAWNANDGAIVRQWLVPGSAAVLALAYSPVDSDLLLSGDGSALGLLWSISSGDIIQEFAPVTVNGVLIAGHSGPVNAVAFSSDGERVATGSSDKLAKVWDADTGQELTKLRGHTGAVRALGFSPDGTQLVTGSDDGTAIVWQLSDASVAHTLQPCTSAVRAASFAADGESILAGIAARNQIQLDSDPSGGQDLNLSYPSPLVLKNSGARPGREYYLWAELRTDRTTPVRKYSHVRVNVIPDLTDAIDANTPLIPYRTVRDPATGRNLRVASVIVPPTEGRKVVDLGELDVGDRLYISLLNTPGYGEVYNWEGLNPLLPDVSGAGRPRGFSLEVLDAQETMYVWYDTSRVFFSPTSKLIIGHYSGSYYAVLDATPRDLPPSLSVRIAPEFADDTGAVGQYVHVNFEGSTKLIAVANSTPFSVPGFSIAGRSAASIAAIETAILARVNALLAPYDFTVSTQAPDSSTVARLTVYFDVSGELTRSNIPDLDGDFERTARDLEFWGLCNYLDPRSQTSSGLAVIGVYDLVQDPNYGTLADAQLGIAIGNAVVHQIGLMVGLRQTTEPPGLVTDIMTEDASQVANATLDFTVSELAAPRPNYVGQRQPLGVQDADQYLVEVIGPG